jgi:hypothetical protein
MSVRLPGELQARQTCRDGRAGLQQQSLGLHEMEKIAHGNAERILHL